MITEMQDTSLDAFIDVRNNFKETRCFQVYEVIKKLGSCPNSVIAKALGLRINQVTGRVNELRNYFKVVGFDKKAYCPIQLTRDGTKRTVCFWKVVKDFDIWDNSGVEE